MRLLLPVAALLGCATAAALPPYASTGSAVANTGASLNYDAVLSARQTSSDEEDLTLDDPDSPIPPEGSDVDSLTSDSSDSSDLISDDDASAGLDASLGDDSSTDTAADGTVTTADGDTFTFVPSGGADSTDLDPSTDGTPSPILANSGLQPSDGSFNLSPVDGSTAADQLADSTASTSGVDSSFSGAGAMTPDPTDVDDFAVPSPVVSGPSSVWTGVPNEAFPAALVAAAPKKSPLSVPGTCKKAPMLRREWRSLSKSQQQKYIGAVQCMQSAPSKSAIHWPIVKTRYEDFVALHANATSGGIDMNKFHGASSFKDAINVARMSRWGIHNVGIFLPWHRYAISLWEKAIQEECGWDEGQPYWDWYLDTPDGGGKWLESPLFRADAFGGNGYYMNGTLYDNAPKKEDATVPGADPAATGGHSHGNKPMPANMPGMNMTTASMRANPSLMDNDMSSIQVMSMSDTTAHKLGLGMGKKKPGGTGGGCIESGPFVKEQLHIGPFGSMANMKNLEIRCLTRDFNPPLAEAAASYASISGVLRAKDFAHFRAGVEKPRVIYQKDKSGQYTIKGRGGDLHTIGHSGVGGEMSDLFTSVNDPLFFLHHANVDRMWWLWQTMDLPKRLKDVKGGPMPRDHNHANEKGGAGGHGAHGKTKGMGDATKKPAAHNDDHTAMKPTPDMADMPGMPMKRDDVPHDPTTNHAPKTEQPSGSKPKPKPKAGRSRIQQELDKIGMPAPLSLQTPMWMGFAGPTRAVGSVMHIQGDGGEGGGFLCYDYETGLEIYGIKDGIFPDLPGAPAAYMNALRGGN